MRSFLSKLLLFLFGLILTACIVSPTIQAVEVRSYSGLVNDFANVLSAETKDKLESKLLAEAQKENGVELAVVTLDSLEGEVIESVALAYFDDWQIGKKGSDNGVLLLLAIQDREVRIHTGYGVEGSLPDGAAGRIIRQDMIPNLQNNDYDQAIEAGVLAILARIADPTIEAAAYANAQEPASIWFALLIVFLIFGVIGLLIWLIAKQAAKTGHTSSGTSSHRSSSSRSSSSGSSSSPSSFSFGGGRSGGGGASGKW